MLAWNLFRIFDLIKHGKETFRLIIFLSDHRKQQLYSVRTSFLSSVISHSVHFSYSPKKLSVQY